MTLFTHLSILAPDCLLKMSLSTRLSYIFLCVILSAVVSGGFGLFNQAKTTAPTNTFGTPGFGTAAGTTGFGTSAGFGLGGTATTQASTGFGTGTGFGAAGAAGTTTGFGAGSTFKGFGTTPGFGGGGTAGFGTGLGATGNLGTTAPGGFGGYGGKCIYYSQTYVTKKKSSFKTCDLFKEIYFI